MSYLDEIIEKVKCKETTETEYLQSCLDILESMRPVVEANEEYYREKGLLEKLVDADHQLQFRVPWIDDKKQYEAMQNSCTNKADKELVFGTSDFCKAATGYGLLYMTEELLKCHGDSLDGKVVLVSGAGNVAIHAIEKAWQLGAVPVTCSDSDGWVYDPDGIDVQVLKEIKETKKSRLTEYVADRPKAEYHEGSGVWQIRGDIALPCATENELTIKDAELLVRNGCGLVCEGAYRPTDGDAITYFRRHDVLFMCGKAANAGGVAISALEATETSKDEEWTLEQADQKLREIMVRIYHNIDDAAKRYGDDGDYVAGVNLAGFERIAGSVLDGDVD